MAGREVRVFHCFARSGGTLVNRVLGAGAGVAVLSEVGPAASVRAPVEQAVEWLGLAWAGEADALGALTFGALVAELDRRAAAAGRALVVRDFCTPNFLAGAYGDVEPSGTFDVLAALAAAGLGARRVAVVRRSAAVYESLVRSMPHLAGLPVGRFAAAYHGYASSLAGVPWFRYEDLVADPVGVLDRLATALDVEPDAGALARFAAFDACTGDLAVAASRGAALDHVETLPDRVDDPAFVRAAAHPLCRAADALFGYEPVGDADGAWAAADAYAAVAAERAARAAALAAEVERLAPDARATAGFRAELDGARARELERDAALAELRARVEELRSHVGDQREALAAAERREAALVGERDDARRRVDELAAAHDEVCGRLARAEAIASERRQQVTWLLGRS